MKRRSPLLSLLFLAACAERGADPEVTLAQDDATFGDDEKAFSSAIATLLDFEFDVAFTTAETPWNARQAVLDYLLYTVGHLNENRGVGRLDKVTLSGLRSEAVSGGVRTRAHVRMPVAWGSKQNLPTAYTFTLPARGDYAGLEAFAAKYGTTCVDWSAHDITSGNMWYYYRPKRAGCALAAEDIVTASATIVVSTENTTGRYPEYHKLWEDNVLSVIAIFGKYEDGATSASDAGIAAYNEFVSRARRELGQGVAVEPAGVPNDPGVAYPDVTLRQDLGGGRSLMMTVLLVDNVRTAGAAFDARYNALSADADVITYHGHAGLGSNVRALVRKGTFVAGKYQIFFMNGCDTFAYVDGALAEKKRQLNPDDPNGTKYLDMLTNAMPSYFQQNADNMIGLVRGLRAYEAPSTYEQMFRQVDPAQIVVSTGEEDNVYYPGYGGGGGGEPPPAFEGYEADGVVSRGDEWRYETPLLRAGTYEFRLRGNGDADLYVKAGARPTLSTWDCRPYGSDSNEACSITVSAPIKIGVMVHGYAASSSFNFRVAQR